MLDAKRRVFLLLEARRVLIASDILESAHRLTHQFQFKATVNNARVQVLLLDERQEEAESVTFNDLALVDTLKAHPVADTLFLLFAERVDRSDGTQHDDASDLLLPNHEPELGHADLAFGWRHARNERSD